ncbi:glycosyltransferase family 4 protein [Bradyrhizobium diazoefficiens]|uniref:Glycosyl transferase n=1 Tax=Bradyrhizobium diazoefficiens TaxID=1355477 RepID=A0A809ZDJ4_9BRAD|nr:glycosyltransferase family 1 protein [Bradyrhizobium diazoefficiens]WLA76838.1 glycosyltransferase family 1 protein [Bradyrhizobium diazoefficiens]BCE23806.1 glycosyl transferase [Bradyrhizobium diazoefficiens]BCE50065.1 glycosyl transferase [Bradyrhizobium diazoefficiens]BCE93574.1 glycosyl transferase [Bradyrhizobium diazoefficiens]BCF28510.1 glycosyl transferase [Bradyrhizobium diazoefficiens]
MSVARPIRLAFTLISRKAWAGGYNYQLNLFNALANYCPGAITPVVFAGEAHEPGELAPVRQVPGVETVCSVHFDRPALTSLLPTMFAQDRGAIFSFRSRKIDAVWENARFFGWQSPYPSVAWIPDFQHRQLPHLFSNKARRRREMGFQLQVVSGRTIILSSRSAERDCLSYYPRTKGRTAVVRFASEPSAELLKLDPVQVLQKYDLPKTYFYVPNQFWRHKNHRIVLEALALLAEGGVRPIVVASGGSDPNEPEYLDQILREAAERGLAQQFRYLGMIPLAEVYALLRASAALINPSRFEGWSTTVEEAKSFGVPMVLSDIDVHREQAEQRAYYFGTDDAPGLAAHLQDFAHPVFVVREMNDQLGERVREFAESFVSTIEQTVRTHR